MADSAPKSSAPIVVSLCIAAVVIVTGFVTGPSVVNCVSSDDFGTCLRQGLEQRGLLPVGQVTQVADSATSEDTAPSAEMAPEAAPEIAAAPEMDVMAAQEMVTQTFLGLVRAEPDGSVVIAGSGTPGAEVEVFANGALLGTVTVESSGDWVLVPDAPLPTGGVEITVGSVEQANQAAQSVIVVIQDDRTSEPLVVASTPGAASQILQGQTASGTVAEAAAEPTPSEGAAPTMDVASLPKEQQATAEAEAPAAAEKVEPVMAAPAEAAPAEAEPAEAAPVVAEPVETVTVEAEPAEAEPQAELQAQVAEMSPAKPVTPPSIDAIEVDGVRNFFAGGGEEGATVRLYVDDQFVADGVVEGGRWLIETDSNVLVSPSQRVRLDMLQAGGSAVTARAEVNFEISLPETVVAEAPAPAPEEPMKVASAPAVTEVAPAPEVAPAAADDVGVAEINAAAAENNAGLLASPPAMPVTAPEAKPEGAAEAQAAPEAEAQVEPAVEPQVEPQATPQAPPQAEQTMQTAEAAPQPQTKLPVQPNTPGMRPGTGTGVAPQVMAATEPEAEMADAEASDASAPSIPTLRAEQVGDERFASGNAIIRRGDNLWTIARRVYGSGVRYTAIYQANQDQIRDPNLIYPGQVFDLPASAE